MFAGRQHPSLDRVTERRACDDDDDGDGNGDDDGDGNGDGDGDDGIDDGGLTNWCSARQTMLLLREKPWHLRTHCDKININVIEKQLISKININLIEKQLINIIK